MVIEAIARFQTLFAASVALVGVIVTLAANARAARKQSERHWAKEAASVRAALRGEIEQLIEAMTNQRERLEEFGDQKEGSFLVPSRTIDTVYRSLMPQLGKLAPHEVEAVMRVYGQYGTYMDKLQLIGSPHASVTYTEVSNQFRSVAVAHCGYILEKATVALERLR